MLHVESLLICYVLKSTRQVFCLCITESGDSCGTDVDITVNTRAGMYSWYM